MDTTTTEPFLRLEPEAAPRLEPLPVVVAGPVRAPRTRISAVLLGVFVLALAFPAIWAVSLVGTLFDRATWLGWLGIAVLVVGFALVGAGVGRELRGLMALRRVDRLRADLASGETARVAAAARRWVETLPQHTRLLDAIRVADTPESLLALLRAGPGAGLAEGADALGRRAALQTGAIIAATPSPALDVLTVGWRGVRLVRQVAALHGMRPGLVGTFALLQRTALAAISVAATELAVNATAHAVISHPLLRHVLGDVAGAGVAARRMIVLARAAATACSPLPPP